MDLNKMGLMSITEDELFAIEGGSVWRWVGGVAGAIAGAVVGGVLGAMVGFAVGYEIGAEADGVGLFS